MKAALSFKWALVKENKKYLFLSFGTLLVFLIAVSAAFLSSRGQSLNPDEGSISMGLSAYESELGSLGLKLSKGQITQEVYLRLSSRLNFFLNSGKIESQFVNPGNLIAGCEFPSLCLFLQGRILPSLGFLFGCFSGTFVFASDFSSGRIKNVFCLSSTRTKQFKEFLLVALLFALFAPLFLCLLLFFLASPLWGEEIAHWFNQSCYSQKVFSYSLSQFANVALLSLLGLFFSSILGSKTKNAFLGFSLPSLLYLISFAFAFGLSSEAPNGFQEIWPSFVPLGGFAWCSGNGQTPVYWIHLSISALTNIASFFAWRSFYVRADL